MRRYRLLRIPMTVLMVIVAVAVVPSCRRAPEEPPVDVADTPEIDLKVLELPQQNPTIGITLNALPAELVTTLNTEYWIEVTDAKTPGIRYAFVATLPVSPGISPSNIAEFEARVGESPDGRITGNGSIETALGTARWASGTYEDDEGPVEDIHVFAPHPSGTGTLILNSVCPAGAATVEERLAVMQELLAHVS